MTRNNRGDYAAMRWYEVHNGLIRRSPSSGAVVADGGWHGGMCVCGVCCGSCNLILPTLGVSRFTMPAPDPILAAELLEYYKRAADEAAELLRRQASAYFLYLIPLWVPRHSRHSPSDTRYSRAPCALRMLLFVPPGCLVRV